jgi:hypothetical protein
MSNSKKRKWTVFFLIKSAGKGSIKEIIQMVNEIRSIPMDNQVRIVLCVNFIRDHLEALLEGNERKLPTRSSEEHTTMFFRLVANDDTKSKFQTRLEIIDERKDFDITDPYFLKRYFRHIVLRPNRAQKYLLITWDHGRFFGIFRDEPERQLPEPPETKREDKNLSRIAIDPLELKREPGADVLTMKELADAIKWAFGDKKIDVMIMVNCFMQSLDAGYALRKRVDYLVAPEGMLYLDGYNYPLLFHVLLSRPDIPPEQLAKLAVTSFPSKVYADGHLRGLRKKKLTALFAVDLRYYTLFVTLIDKLVDALLLKIPEVKKILRDAKNHSLIDINLYDFFSFISYIESKDIFKNDALAASLVLSLREIVILESFIGNGAPIKSPDDVISNSSGFTVFIPNDIPSTPSQTPGMDDFLTTEFYLESKWHLFIEELLSP